MHIKATEANEHIDVTPCTDARGNWAPGPRLQCPADASDEWQRNISQLLGRAYHGDDQLVRERS